MNLNWKTADEFNVSKYEIEVSSNGRDFVKIGEQIAELRFKTKKTKTEIDQNTT
jgi:hypothetical protein